MVEFDTDPRHLGCKIVLVFVSKEVKLDTVRKIKEEIFPFGEMEEGYDFPGGKESIELNTNQDRIDMARLQEMVELYRPEEKEFVKINTEVEESNISPMPLGQVYFIFVLRERMSTDDVKRKVVPRIGITSIDRIGEEELDVKMMGDKFRLGSDWSTKGKVSEMVENARIIRQELPVERMFLTCEIV
jgi:hypothetical protein